MKICIDATPLLMASAGIKTYLYHWIDHLRRAAGKDIRIETFPRFGRSQPLQHQRSQEGVLRTVQGLAQLQLSNLAHLPPIGLRNPDIFHACKLRTPPRGARL